MEDELTNRRNPPMQFAVSFNPLSRAMRNGCALHHASRPHRRSRLRVIPASISAWLALCAVPAQAQYDIVIGPGFYNYSQKFNQKSGQIVGSTTIDPTPPYPANLGGPGVSVEIGGSAIIQPDAGSTPGNINIYSHYRSGAPNDGLYVSSGSLTISGSAHGYGTYVSTDGLDVYGIYAPFSSSQAVATTLDATNLYVTTAGNGAIGIRAYGTSMGAPVITLRDSSITTASGFTSAYGVYAWAGPTINLIDTAVSALGTSTYGIVSSASTINLTNGSVTTVAPSAYAMYVYSGSKLTVNGTAINTSGTSGIGLYESGGSSATLTNAQFATTGANAHGIYSTGATLSADGGAITTTGSGAHGVWLTGGSSASISDMNIETRGASARGVYVNGAGTTASLAGDRISTLADNGYGVYAVTNVAVKLQDTSVSTLGATAYGIYAGTASTLDMSGGGVSTAGNTAHAVWLASASSGTIADATISTSGAAARGVYVNGDGTNATLTDDRVSTSGDTAYGVYGTSSAALAMQGGSVATNGANAYAVWFSGAANGTLAGTTISTAGGNAYGLLVGGSAASATATDVTVNTTGGGAAGYYVWTTGLLHAYGGSVSTSGANAAGIVVDGLSSATLDRDANGAGMSVTAGGANGNAVRVSNGGTFTATGASLHARGANGNGLSLIGTATTAAAASPADPAVGDTPGADTTPVPTAVAAPVEAAAARVAAAVVHAAGPVETVTLNDTTVQSDNAAGIAVAGGIANVALTGSTITGATAALQATTTGSTPSTLTVNAAGSTLNGAVLTDADSTTALSLTNASRWNVGGDSTLTTLVNANSVIDILAAPDQVQTPTTASSYRAVNVTGDYTGAQGTLGVNTWLDKGGALGAQFTDRLLVAGNASGTTLVDVKPVAGSPGGVTSLTGQITHSDGISIVQVAGASSAGAFALPGGYAVAPDSPYEYRLYAYGPGSVHGTADAAQRVVSGSGNGFWDYRLQSAYVTPEGPVDPDEPGVQPGPEPQPEPNPEPNPEPIPGPGGELDYPIPPDARPAVAPQVAAYLSAPAAFLYAGMLDMDTLHRRLGEIRDDGDLGRDGGPAEMFFRAYGGDFNYSSNIGFQQFGYDMSGDYSAIQFGANALKLRNDNGIWRFGLAGSVGWLHFEPDAVDGPSSSRSNIYRLSGYGTYQSRQGWYFDGILSLGWFNGDVTTGARGQAMKLQGSSYAASVEAGYPFALPYRINVEPQIQLIGQHLGFHNSTDVDDLDVNIGSQNQLTGRLGVRVTRPIDVSTGRLTPYAAIDVLHSFTNGTNVQVSDVQFVSGKMGDALQYSLGISGSYTPKLSLYGRVSYQQQIGNAGFRGWLVNGGARYLF
ncbi:outer membrane autotransporter protein [Paraburkholderia unamae]|uniref:Outer membrane autotransporter protein n=1 Tax=Paraburkholderia unamae TaxID=219649 RepID=A0ABX5K7C2_9BURK|nr:outer membrane autotransporter protein [Paraburkholderia unamae]